ncbi:class I SAM-dependent methyltransferase [Corynebacterium glaucum]|nr:class I SAM-dependent methyltransferase [Corynebacterium glaucum]
MTGRARPGDHLATIDPDRWPGIATLPDVATTTMRARRAESTFARAVSAAGLTFDGNNADLIVDYAELFSRIAVNGWVGLAEGYLAGEWRTASSHKLVDVLAALITANYRPKTIRLKPSSGASSGEPPASLVAHYSGDGMSPFQGHFATGVPTTERVIVKSWARGAGKRSEPARHYVDITEFGAPLNTMRQDLADAQTRSAEMLLEAAHTQSGTHLLVSPVPGGALPLAAIRLGATVDCVVSETGDARTLKELLVFAGAADAVRVMSPDELNSTVGAFDAIISAEYLETLSPRSKASYLAGIDAVLAPGGRVAMQTIVRTETMTPAANAALESLRAYIWPGLSFATPEELARLVDRHTGLRVISETRAPEHLVASLSLQRTTFDGRARDAAADGFDPVYRRLWTWQFALREALARLGMLNLTQLTLVPRSRRGRR